MNFIDKNQVYKAVYIFPLVYAGVNTTVYYINVKYRTSTL